MVELVNSMGCVKKFDSLESAEYWRGEQPFPREWQVRSGK